MKKRFFPHYCDARNDERVIQLRIKYNAAGYGVYFMILERMAEMDEPIIKCDYKTISYDLRVKQSLVKSVIEDFGLFEIVGGYFYSKSFMRREDEKEKRIEKLREAGKRGMEKRWGAGKEDDVKPEEPKPVTDPKPSKKESAEPDLSFVEESMRPALMEWIGYKKDRKDKKLSERSLKMAYKRLTELSGGDADIAMRIVEQSEANNWAGMFALKEDNNSYGNRSSQAADRMEKLASILTD